MEASNKKNIKKTTPGQFRFLVAAMDDFPELATARPIFGKSKADIEEKWSNVTNRINAVGPPVRNSSDWKRIWADMKCRTKIKISQNAKAMKGTGGGPAVSNALTDIEKDIDRICHLSSAAAPSGVSFGVKSSTTTTSTPIVLAVTPPRRSTNVAVVSPTSSEKLQSQFVSLLSPTPPSYDLTATTKVTSTSLAEKPYQKRPNKKRKLTESREEEREEVQLLKRQVEQNNLLVEEMKAQTRSIESMADSLRGIHQVMNELLRHLRDE